MSAREPLLQIRGLGVVYRRRAGLLGLRHQELRAVDGVDLDVGRGETVGLVGESGSGKSTVAQAIERLVPVSSGTVRLDGDDLAAARGRVLRTLRQRVQMVFQDPYSSLDPSMTIATALAEPLRVHGHGTTDVDDAVREAIEAVGLRADDLAKYPHEFSGGQRQRIAIARALILDPALIVLDEAVSALDVSTRAQILTLLQTLREERGLAFLFIGHDLAVVRRMSDRIAVMYLGRIVEEGPADRVVSAPAHPYTAALLAAVPDPRRGVSGERRAMVTRGRAPDPWDRPPGCAFASRCPFVMDLCTSVDPVASDLGAAGSAACHLHTDGPRLDGRSVLTLVDATASGRTGDSAGEAAGRVR